MKEFEISGKLIYTMGGYRVDGNAHPGVYLLDNVHVQSINGTPSNVNKRNLISNVLHLGGFGGGKVINDMQLKTPMPKVGQVKRVGVKYKATVKMHPLVAIPTVISLELHGEKLIRSHRAKSKKALRAYTLRPWSDSRGPL